MQLFRNDKSLVIQYEPNDWAGKILFTMMILFVYGHNTILLKLIRKWSYTWGFCIIASYIIYKRQLNIPSLIESWPHCSLQNHAQLTDSGAPWGPQQKTLASCKDWGRLWSNNGNSPMNDFVKRFCLPTQYWLIPFHSVHGVLTQRQCCMISSTWIWYISGDVG